MASPAFDTKLETIGQVLAGPWRKPINMLLEQTYDNHVSLHDDAMAQKLGFKAGPIEGPTHYSQFVPLVEAIWGERFFKEGCLSAHYRNMVMEGEEVRAFIEREPGEGPIADTLHAHRLVLGQELPDLQRLGPREEVVAAGHELIEAQPSGVFDHGLQGFGVAVNVGDAQEAHGLAACSRAPRRCLSGGSSRHDPC